MPSIPIPPPAAVGAPVPHNHVAGLLSAYGDGWLTSATDSLAFDGLLMGSRPGWHTGYLLAVVAVNLIANLVLIPIFGLPGAAMSTATSMIASALLLRGLVRWTLQLRI